jgi:hypothetical protein
VSNLVLGILLFHLSGCATVETRFQQRPGEVEHLFPSSKRAGEMTQGFADYIQAKEIQVDPYFGALVGIPILGWMLGEHALALTSDILLLPVDACIINKKARKREEERLERLECLEALRAKESDGGTD